MYYAQIDKNGKVKAITESSSAVTGDGVIEIQSYDISILNHTYEDGIFIPPSPGVTPKSELQILAEKVGALSLTLSDIAGKVDTIKSDVAIIKNK